MEIPNFMIKFNNNSLLLGCAMLTMPLVTYAQTSSSERSPLGVSTVTLSSVWIQPLKRASAEAISLNHAQISAQANGEVLKLAVEVGDAVEKDDVLVELDCRQSRLSEAVLNDVLKLAGKEYQRAQALQKTNTIADQELSRLQSSLEQARIRIQQAELSVENCIVSAPFSGVVTERQVQLGILATPGLPLLKLLQLDTLEVEVELSSEELDSLQGRKDIRFLSDQGSYPLTMRAILPLVNPTTNKRSVRLRFSAGMPLPGTSGEVAWRAGGHYLPVDLIVERDAQLGYFMLADDRARYVVLQDARPGHPARLSADITEPQNIEVVVEGRYALQQGDTVVRRQATND